MIRTNGKIRNIAIIAHVDHGKTTLVDALFREAGVHLKKGENTTRIMDSGALERERGITISAKNCAIEYKGVKINILDTPGHADFGGEVERALAMVDGVVLLCDAAEGPLPQTRFVLEKALAKKLKVIVVINKIDRKDARPAEVLDDVYELLIDLSGDENMLNCPVFFAVGRDGKCGTSPDAANDSVAILLDSILENIPAPSYDDEEPFGMLVCDLSYSDFLGRLAIGRVMNGTAHVNDSLVCIGSDGNPTPLKITKLQTYDGPSFSETQTADPGDIIVLSGIENVEIGDTICTKSNIKALERVKVAEPTVEMIFCQNYTPLALTEGKIGTSAKINERLVKETLKNISIKFEKNPDDTFTVKGRGEFQICILIESMRREGFELCVGRPRVIFKTGPNGEKLEPIEEVIFDVPSEYQGAVMEKVGFRKGTVEDIRYLPSDRVKIVCDIPSRTLIGFRDEFLTSTKGMGIMNSSLKGYEEYKGDVRTRASGSLVCDRRGKAVAYGIWELEDRGRMFIVPGDELYEGMIVGERNKEGDLMINPTKTKKLTNLRASGKDEAVTLIPVVPMTLEQAVQFISDDEYVEVTPKSVRMCKKILSTQQRRIFNSRGEIPEYLK